MPRLKDKVAIVAGAGSIAEGWSNGKATAVLFAREGAKVFAVDRDMKAAQETCDDHRGRGRRMRRRINATCRSPREVDAMVAACIAKYGRVDVLFNNVGMQVVGGPLEVKEEDWDRLMTVNVKSMYLTCRAVIPHMIQQGGGSIINNSSTAGIRFTYANVAYAASKGAVKQLSQNIGVQYAAKGIRCNCRDAGLYRDAAHHRPSAQKQSGRLRRRRSRSGRWRCRAASSAPAGMSPTACSISPRDESQFVNATELVIDGGQTASVTGKVWEHDGDHRIHRLRRDGRADRRAADRCRLHGAPVRSARRGDARRWSSAAASRRNRRATPRPAPKSRSPACPRPRSAARSRSARMASIGCGVAARLCRDVDDRLARRSRRSRPSSRKKNIAMLDAPVSGGPRGARAGTLSTMVAGEHAAFERVKPMFEALARNVFYVGDKPGLGR